MAEATISPLKRQREEQEQEIMSQEEEEVKRQKLSSPSSSSYNQVLCLLDDAEVQNEADNDLTSLIATLQQEVSTEEQNAAVFEEKQSLSSSCSSCSSSCASKEEEEEYECDKEKVMKHLSEASDDELGIPNTEIGGSNYEIINSETNQDYVNGLWELEDEAANYYTLLQSELFM